MKSLFPLLKKQNTIKILKMVLLHIFIVSIGKWVYNKYILLPQESLVDKKEMSMLNKINSLLDIQKQEQEEQEEQKQ